jgi:phosphoenolpyruvate carboxykinase (ATP)
MFKEKLRRHGSQVWLLNTGWSGGPAGKASRMKLGVTRALLNAALSGQLNQVAYTPDPVFGLEVPVACPGVESAILLPRNVWKNPQEYDQKARHLAQLFQENMKRYA